jgi:two-component system sensor histidine kinase MtrB
MEMFGRRSAAASVKSMVAAVMAWLGLSAFVAAFALIAITHYMHRAVTAMMAATDSVHTAEEMEVDLLVHSRLADRLGRAQLEGQLRGWLLEIRLHVDSPEEERLVQEVAARVDSYLAESHRAEADGLSVSEVAAEVTAELEAAFLPLESLVHLNVQQTRETAARAARWDRMSNYLGVGVASVLVLSLASVLVWLRWFAFRSVLELETAMRRFAEGDKSARAPVTGARELRDIAGRFNEMAAAIERQYDNQIAFLGGVVHDLRNPLSVLEMSSTALDPDRPQRSADHGRKAFSVMKRQLERMKRMLEDLLDAARVEAGHLELRITRRDLREICGEVADMFREATTQHEIRVLLPDSPQLLAVDPLRIEQVLANLVSNAIKYSPRGGLIEVRLEPEAEHVVLEVTDQGIGIPKEDQSRIFEPFRRSGASRGLVPGAGLGLFVARRIVEAHHGRIEVSSEAGNGTRFRVLLPRAQPASAVAA